MNSTGIGEFLKFAWEQFRPAHASPEAEILTRVFEAGSYKLEPNDLRPVGADG